MKRAGITCIVLALGFALLIPLRYSSAYWSRGHVHHHHSRAWWRRHRALMRRRRERAALRKRQHETAALVNGGAAPLTGANMMLPASWSWSASSISERKFAIKGENNSSIGMAVFSRVVSQETAPAGLHRGVIGNVSFSQLRRMVINRMLNEDGWVVNDVERVINGRKVFLVSAQSGANGVAALSHSFYFTAIDGNVYELSLTGPVTSSEFLAAEGEKFLTSLEPATTEDVATSSAHLSRAR